MTVGISRPLLHRLLWERRYGDDLVEINQVELAEQLAVTKHTMNRVIKAMMDDGRLAAEAEHTYRVADPDDAALPVE